MQRPAVTRLLILPGRPREKGSPVVGRRMAAVILPEEIKVPIRRTRLFRLLIPSVLIGSVVHHQIHDQPHSPPVHLRKKPLEILHRAKFFHDPVIVSDIITVVVIGRIVDRRKPQRIHAQLLQVIQPADDALQIADAVPVAVTETARVDLIKYRLFPPFGRNLPCRNRRFLLLTVHQLQQRIEKVQPEPSAGQLLSQSVTARQIRQRAQLQIRHRPIGNEPLRQSQLQKHSRQRVMSHRIIIQFPDRAVISQPVFFLLFPHIVTTSFPYLSLYTKICEPLQTFPSSLQIRSYSSSSSLYFFLYK